MPIRTLPRSRETIVTSIEPLMMIFSPALRLSTSMIIPFREKNKILCLSYEHISCLTQMSAFIGILGNEAKLAARRRHKTVSVNAH